MFAFALSDGPPYEVHDSKPFFVQSLPEGQLRIVDAKGKVGRADRATVNGQIMLYGQTLWLKDAAYPIRYELVSRDDDSFCFA